MLEAITLNVTKDLKRKLQILAANDSRKLSSFCKVQLEKLAESVVLPLNSIACLPSSFGIVKFSVSEVIEPPMFKLKKFICAICPSCRVKVFDLNTETMTGVCLSCGFKSSDYKTDMAKRRK